MSKLLRYIAIQLKFCAQTKNRRLLLRTVNLANYCFTTVVAAAAAIVVFVVVCWTCVLRQLTQQSIRVPKNLHKCIIFPFCTYIEFIILLRTLLLYFSDCILMDANQFRNYFRHTVFIFRWCGGKEREEGRKKASQINRCLTNELHTISMWFFALLMSKTWG